jgi:CheY-like chemotaxis protein
VVEDNPDFLVAIARMLRILGYEIATATTAGEAIEKIENWRPKCMILDLLLPDENGIAVLRKARESETGIRVAVVTAVDRASAIDEMETLKPDVVFQKPVDVVALAGWLMSDD